MASLQVQTADQIRDQMLQTFSNELIRRGIPNPNVSEGTYAYILFNTIAQQNAMIQNNTSIQADALMVDTAQGNDLIRIAATYGLTLQPATPSEGVIQVFTTSLTGIAIPVGAQLIDPAGLAYQVINQAGLTNVINNGFLDIQSIDTGSGTNLLPGTVLRWTSPPPFVTSTAVVSAIPPFNGGLVGGSPLETIEQLRARIYQTLQNPPGGGNWSQVQQIVAASTSLVEMPFIYPAVNGPGTCGVCVTGHSTPTDKTRNIYDFTTGGVDPLKTYIIPALIGNFPEFVEFYDGYTNYGYVSGVNPIGTNVSIEMTLPLPISALTPGSGGGWIDQIQFPSLDPIYNPYYCAVVSATSSSLITVNAAVAPVGTLTGGTYINCGQTITWLSTNDWIPRSATIVSYTVSGNAYTLFLSNPLVDSLGGSIAAGNWISPGAVNSANYYNYVLNIFAGLGPGEKLANNYLTGNLYRGARHPAVTSGTWNSALGPGALKFLEETGPEVLNVQFLYRSNYQNINTSRDGFFIPNPPASVSSIPGITNVENGRPGILIPAQIGFYATDMNGN